MVNITSEDNKEVQGKEKMNVFRERKSICILKGHRPHILGPDWGLRQWIWAYFGGLGTFLVHIESSRGEFGPILGVDLDLFWGGWLGLFWPRSAAAGVVLGLFWPICLGFGLLWGVLGLFWPV